MWLDREKRLLENRNRDTWQLPVFGKDGVYLGNVVSQIVQPSEYMVRYFLVYSAENNYRFLLPSDTVESMEEQQRIRCSLDSDQVMKFPQFEEEIDRQAEQEIYDIIHRRPYWE